MWSIRYTVSQLRGLYIELVLQNRCQSGTEPSCSQSRQHPVNIINPPTRGSFNRARTPIVAA